VRRREKGGAWVAPSLLDRQMRYSPIPYVTYPGCIPDVYDLFSFSENVSWVGVSLTNPIYLIFFVIFMLPNTSVCPEVDR
jgi:hypothetical protein